MSNNKAELLQLTETWDAILNENGYVDGDRFTIEETFTTPDAPILFPKAVSRVLREAEEPQRNIIKLFSVVNTKARSVEFPAVNSIQAYEIPEGQEYPEQNLTFQPQVEGRVSKKGVKCTFTDEVVADSQWDIIGLHLRAVGRAMARLKEQIAVGRLLNGAGLVVFDNAGAEPDTSGRDINGAQNDTIVWEDVITMAAALQAQNHVATDLIMHPLMWVAFASRNPAWLSQANLNITSKDKWSMVDQVSPFGFNVIQSNVIPFTAADPGVTPAVSDIIMIDRNDLGTQLVKEGLSLEDFDMPTRDVRGLKIRERYDIVVHGEGENIAVARNVAIAPTYDVVVTNEMP